MTKEENNARKTNFYSILGPPNAGKTSLAYRLYSGIFYEELRLSNRKFEEVKVDGFSLRSLNIWENDLNNETWENLSVGCIGSILIVDISTNEGIKKGHEFYHKIIKPSVVLNGIPMVIFGNKTDIRSYDEIMLSKDLEVTINEKYLMIQCISCKTTEGILKGINWLMNRTNTIFYIPSFRK